MSSSNEESARSVPMAEMLNDANIDCVIALDRERKIHTWNRMCELLTGREKADILGRPFDAVFPPAPATEAVHAAIGQALLGRQSFLPPEAASLIGSHTETHVIPLKDGAGAAVGVMLVVHDVAHRQKAELELKRLNLLLARKAHELERRNEEMISFSRVMSHDLREPIRKIQIFTNMLLTREGAPRAAEAASLLPRIYQSASRAEKISGDISSFFHIQKTSEPLTPVDLDLTLKMTEDHFHREIAARQVFIVAEQLPVVPGYATLIRRLFENILDNALRFSAPDRKLQLVICCGQTTGATIAHRHALPSASYAWLSFADNGLGFDPQYGEQIFELFKQLHRGEVASGSGIGLSLCRKIMELHHGFITVQSAPDAGSTFTCYFPLETGDGQ